MKRVPHFVTYQGADGLWYWRLVAANEKVIADGSEGYAKRPNCRRAVARLRVVVPAAPLAD